MSVDFRFVSYNYPFQSNVALTATSEDNEFPAVNLCKELRSKTWRSAGYYVIVSGTNDKINFKEAAAGGELTATITAGSYSRSALASEIKTQLESVGAETYTVSFGSGTGLWTVSHAGAELELLFDSGTDSATSCRDVIGFGTNDYTGGTSYDGSTIAIHTVERLIVDLKTQEEIDTFAALYDPRLGIKYTEDAVIKLKGNHADSWDSPGVEVTLTIDQDFSVMSHYFSTDQSYRFWCVEIVDPGNPNLYVDLGTLVLGKSETLERIPNNGFTYKENDPSKETKTDYQNIYNDEFPIYREVRFNYSVLEYTQVQTLEKIYQRVGRSTPVFVTLDATEQLFNRNNFSLFARLGRSQDFRHINRQYFSSQMNLTEVF